MALLQFAPARLTDDEVDTGSATPAMTTPH